MLVSDRLYQCKCYLLQQKIVSFIVWDVTLIICKGICSTQHVFV